MTRTSFGRGSEMTDPLPVYLVHYNAPEWVRSACDSILRSDIPVALTIVDNSGNLTGPDSRVRVIRPEKNTGYAGGANVAIRDWLTSNSDFCVIGSHDLHLDEAALRLMMEAMRAQPALGILGPKLGRDGTLPEPEFGLEEVQWVSGTCLMMRRACIAQVGPLDERYISYAEDFDLCVRAGDHGWNVGLVREAVGHGLGTAHGGQAPRRLANAVLFDIKRYGYLSGFRTIGRIEVRALKDLLRGDFRHFASAQVALPIALRHVLSYRRLPEVAHLGERRGPRMNL